MGNPEPISLPPNPLDGPAKVLAAVGTVWIFVMMLLVVADVVGRNFLNMPITGVSEFAARSVASIVFLQLATAICSGRMTRSDFVLNLLKHRAPGFVKALDILNVLVGSFLFFALAVIAWPEFSEALSSHEFFGVQGVYTVPAWPFRGLIVLGSLFAAVAYLGCLPGLVRQQAGRPS